MSPRFERGPDKRMGAGGRGAGRPQRFSGPKPEWKRDADAGGRERPSRDGGSRESGSRGVGPRDAWSRAGGARDGGAGDAEHHRGGAPRAAGRALYTQLFHLQLLRVRRGGGRRLGARGLLKKTPFFFYLCWLIKPI